MKKICLSIISFIFCCSWIFGAFSVSATEFEMTRKIVLEIPKGPDNPRNGEGDFIRLKDGRIIFVYAQYSGNSWLDHASANIVQRISSDNGKTWSEPEIVVQRDEDIQNVMSPSFLRLQDGRIALFYLRKVSSADCRPYVRISEDETKTWSEPTCCLTDDVDYYVVNNARIIQLRDGSVLIPAARHHYADGKNDGWSREGFILRSTDGCKTFQREEIELIPGGPHFQEPGLVELADGTVFLYYRNSSGAQYGMKSTDGGKTWGKDVATHFVSPRSPLSIYPIPKTERYLAVWNEDKGARDPLTLAVLDSELNFLWKTTLDKSDEKLKRCFCYPAIFSLGNNEFLIAYYVGPPAYGLEGTRVVKIKLEEK
ncbi:MAG: sialidase family protein [Planctomycetia bacterium]|nr:sialidase family protein [Planctomycetia bacterium]